MAIDLIKKLKLNHFEYIAGSDTFPFNKPDPRHLTNVVEILGGSLKKTIMVGDSEVDLGPVLVQKYRSFLENGYTEKIKMKLNIMIP